MRFLFACVAMVPVCVRHRPRLTRGEWALGAASVVKKLKQKRENQQPGWDLSVGVTRL